MGTKTYDNPSNLEKTLSNEHSHDNSGDLRADVKIFNYPSKGEVDEKVQRMNKQNLSNHETLLNSEETDNSSGRSLGLKPAELVIVGRKYLE